MSATEILIADLPSRTGRSEEVMATGGKCAVIGLDAAPYEVELSRNFFVRRFHQPNRFHRWMQKVWFGFRWHERKPTNLP